VTGIQFGDGMPIGAKVDEKNEYDNFIILRAALWASEKLQAYRRTSRSEPYSKYRKRNESCQYSLRADI